MGFKDLCMSLLFFAQISSNGVANNTDQTELIKDQIVFAGYSGIPERDKKAGFTVAGPFYGDDEAQATQLEKCHQAELPALAQITFPKTIFEAPLDNDFIESEVKNKIEFLESKATIYGWCVQPEETRPWRPREVEFLKLVSAAIRKFDTKQRPIFHYQPNHRDAKTLRATALETNIIGKGCYVNSAGYKNDRSWVRWSVEQMLLSMNDSPHAKECWVMPELCADPLPEENEIIRDWVRHDVYLGLASGAKGVLIWSLFKRPAVKNTWAIWYDAYSECAKELNCQPKNFAKILLNGQITDQYKVSFHNQASHATQSKRSDSSLESNTVQADEGIQQTRYPLTYKVWNFQNSDYLIIINSTPNQDYIKIEGISAQQKVDYYISDQTDIPINTKKIPIKPWEVIILKITS